MIFYTGKRKKTKIATNLNLTPPMHATFFLVRAVVAECLREKFDTLTSAAPPAARAGWGSHNGKGAIVSGFGRAQLQGCTMFEAVEFLAARFPGRCVERLAAMPLRIAR